MDFDRLIDLEQKGWQALSGDGGAEFYDLFLADDAFMVLPFGLLEREACIEAIASAPPWSSYELSDLHVAVLGNDAAMVTYRAVAQREGQAEYRALMSTTYVWQDDEWLIACHQQTPLMEPATQDQP